MTVFHAKDGLFWIVTRLGGMTPGQGYGLLTLGPRVQGSVAAIALLFIQAAVL